MQRHCQPYSEWHFYAIVHFTDSRPRHGTWNHVFHFFHHVFHNAVRMQESKQ